MSAERYHELIVTGYAPAQILSCPEGDPCACERSIRAGGVYVRDCALQNLLDASRVKQSEGQSAAFAEYVAHRRDNGDGS